MLSSVGILPVQLQSYVPAAKHGAHRLKPNLKVRNHHQSSAGTACSTAVNSFWGLQKENILPKVQRIHKSLDLLET